MIKTIILNSFELILLLFLDSCFPSPSTDLNNNGEPPRKKQTRQAINGDLSDILVPVNPILALKNLIPNLVYETHSNNISPLAKILKLQIPMIPPMPQLNWPGKSSIPLLVIMSLQKMHPKAVIQTHMPDIVLGC